MSGSDYHDFVQIPGGGQQVPPTFIAQPGALTTGGLSLVTAQISTQTNTNTTGSIGISSIVNAEQILAVAGPTYSAAGSRQAV